MGQNDETLPGATSFQPWGFREAFLPGALALPLGAVPPAGGKKGDVKWDDFPCNHWEKKTKQNIGTMGTIGF